MDKLGTTLYESNTDSSTKIITITGIGDFFSSGNDLNNWKDGSIPEIKEKSRKYVLYVLEFKMLAFYYFCTMNSLPCSIF